MKIKQGCLCRGSGKVFIEIILEGLSPQDTVSAQAFVHDKIAVPCEIFPLDVFADVADASNVAGAPNVTGASRAANASNLTHLPNVANVPHASKDTTTYVAIVPYLHITQELLIVVFDQDLQTKAHKSFTLHPEGMKWTSRLNYRRHSRECARIRNFDEERIDRELDFRFDHLTWSGERMIVRGNLRMPAERSKVPDIFCYTNSFEPIAIQFYELSTAKLRCVQDSPVDRKEVAFSITFPTTFEEFIIAGAELAPRARSEHFVSGFYSVEKSFFEKLESRGRLLHVNAQFDSSYREWFDQKKVKPRALLAQRAYSFDDNPSFSIIVPLYKTPLDFFDEMVDSVVAQSYPNWELILVNATPEDEKLSARIAERAQDDGRIKTVTLEGNRGISENTNEGIKVAIGDYVAFFDHDDVLEPNILFEYVNALHKNPAIDLLYCDEDKLLPDGTVTEPFFKPDFSIDLLRNNNYICHMLTIRKSLLDQLTPNSAEFDGAQDHNLTLQAVEKARAVGHVAKVLYHWRISENSTAATADNKPYATQVGVKAVQNHLDRVGIKAKVSPSRRPFTYKLDYSVPADHPLVSIIIPNKDGLEYLTRCLASIQEKTTYDNYEIIIVENNSEDQATFDYYNSLDDPRIDIVYWPGEFNFSKIINFGASKAQGEYYLLLNNDTEVLSPDWIEEMLGRCAREDVGAVGVRLFYPDYSLQHAGLVVVGGGSSGCVACHLNRRLPYGQAGYFALSDSEQNFSAVTAACMMVSKKDFDLVEGFSEELPVAFNDVDFCLKLREQNKLILYTPEVELIHYESVTRGGVDSLEKRAQFIYECAYMHTRWSHFYAEGDPYYSNNFDLNLPEVFHYQLSKLD